MVEGVFHNDAPYVTLTIRGERGAAKINFIVDTGFAGALALPRDFLHEIGASRMGSDVLRLADDTHRLFAIYIVTVDEDEQERVLQVLEKDSDPLLGTSFLREQMLTVEVTDGGAVTIEEL